ncbi:MAG: hypothetical protein GXY44_16015 [Phycisphaerales bacterium]|nr:hypothetical protein [Phycisphaerales bacterium]
MRIALWTIIWGMSWLPLAAVDLDVAYPVEFRGRRLGEVLGELANQWGVSYLLDDSVKAEALETPIRMSSKFLTGREVVIWLARLGGLEATIKEGGYFLIEAGALDRGQDSGHSAVASKDDPRWVTAQAVQASFEWIDAPLSRVIEDIAAQFRLDLIVHTDIQERHPLVFFNQDKASVKDVVYCLQDQLKADVTFNNGALWACSGAMFREQIAFSQASSVNLESIAVPVVAPSRPTYLEQSIQLDSGIRSWRDFSEFLDQLDGLSIRMDHGAGVSYPAIQASGALVDVLEGLRLLKLLDWRYSAQSSGTGGIIDMTICADD